MDHYFGKYQRFDTVSKKEGGALVGADNLAGDVYSIEMELNEGIYRAWLVNRFNKRVGFFSPEFSRELSVHIANGLTAKAILSFIAYTDHPDPGIYWGEMAVICYKPTYEAEFTTFIEGVSKKLSSGTRVDITLNDDGVNKVISSKGSWLPDKSVPMPEKTRGTAIIKSRRSFTENMVEQGRKKNKGCYVLSWVFIVAIVALILFGLKSCGVF